LNTLEVYHKYRSAINNIPTVRRLLSENRRYVFLKDISLEEFKILIDGTDKLVRNFKDYDLPPLVVPIFVRFSANTWLTKQAPTGGKTI